MEVKFIHDGSVQRQLIKRMSFRNALGMCFTKEAHRGKAHTQLLKCCMLMGVQGCLVELRD